jgi:hypothetical protein
MWELELGVDFGVSLGVGVSLVSANYEFRRSIHKHALESRIMIFRLEK